MEFVPTVKIKVAPCEGNPEGIVIINQSDFDPLRHQTVEQFETIERLKAEQQRKEAEQAAADAEAAKKAAEEEAAKKAADAGETNKAAEEASREAADKPAEPKKKGASK